LYRIAQISREQFPRSILVISSPTRPTRATRHPLDNATRMSRVSSVSGDFPFQLATCLPDWWPAVCCSVSCHSPNSTSTTRTTCCGQDASILVGSLSDTSDTPDFLVTCQRHHREYVTRMLRGNCSRGISAYAAIDLAAVVILFCRHQVLLIGLLTYFLTQCLLFVTYENVYTFNDRRYVVGLEYN